MTEEPWLRGPIEGVDPLIAPVLYAFIQAREDLARFTEGLTAEQLWPEVGFHIRHISGSVDRLMTYLQQNQLSETQMEFLRSEKTTGASRAELLSELDQTLQRAENVIRALSPSVLKDEREVGRKRLPTTVIGLLTHIAEHTQRHVGQAIMAAKLARLR